MSLLRGLLIGLAVFMAAVLSLPVVILAAPFYLVAWLTRLAANRLHLEPASVAWRELVEYEPVIGWRPKPNLDVYGRADDVFHLTTGDDGWRGTIPVEDADIVVFGDSFAFGHGADDDRMYTAFCRGLDVKPIGSDGYDMVHGLLWMERMAPSLAGKTVFWFVYYGNDLWENLLPEMGHYRKPFVRQRTTQSAWELVTDHVNPEPWPFPSRHSHHERLAEICTPGSRLSERALGACDFLIERASAVCDEAGARLVVVGIPDRVQLTRRGRAKLAQLGPRDGNVDVRWPDVRLRETCSRLGAEFVAFTDHITPRDYLVQDIHWRTSGHRKMGELLHRVHTDRPPSGQTAPERVTRRVARSA